MASSGGKKERTRVNTSFLNLARPLILVTGSVLTVALVMSSSANAQMFRGQILYEEKCAACHSSSATGSRAPTRETLIEFAPERVLEAITNGAMKSQADGLSDEQKRAIAEYISLR